MGWTYNWLRKPGHYTVFALNGAERLAMDEATIKNDSLHIPMGLFESELVGKIDGDRLTGVWRKRRTNLSYQSVPFTARFGQTFRFRASGAAPAANLSGKWQTLFRSATPGDTTVAVGVFEQKNSAVTGTFLTPTGDYRYLAGDVVGDSLFLSCFDGNHAFLFKANMGTLAAGSTKTLTGVFHSGPGIPRNLDGPTRPQRRPARPRQTDVCETRTNVHLRFPRRHGQDRFAQRPAVQG